MHDFEMNGRAAYRSGRPRTPATDRSFMAELRKLDGAMAKVLALRAWLRGWNQEHRQEKMH